MNPQRTVEHLYLSVDGDVVDEPLISYDDRNSGDPRPFGFAGIEAGGFIQFDTASSATVEIKDATGRVILAAGDAYTENTAIDPIPAGVQGPLTVTTSGSDGVILIHWYVRR